MDFDPDSPTDTEVLAAMRAAGWTPVQIAAATQAAAMLEQFDPPPPTVDRVLVLMDGTDSTFIEGDELDAFDAEDGHA